MIQNNTKEAVQISQKWETVLLLFLRVHLAAHIFYFSRSMPTS